MAGGYPEALDALHRQVSPAALPDAAEGPLTRLGLAVARAEPEPPAELSAGPLTTAARQFARGLLALHQELLETVLGQVMRHLEGRTSGGTTLASRDLIRGQLAEIALRLSETSEVIARPREDSPQAGWRLHLRQVAAGRSLLLLLGASGFLASGPGRDLHLAEVTGNVYLHPAGTADD